MPGTGPQSMINLGNDVAKCLVRLDDPDIREYSLRSPGGLFSKGMSIATKGFSAGGFRERIKTQRPRDTYAMGATTGSTALPAAHGMYRYEDLIYKRAHFNDILSVVKYEEQFVDYVNAAPTYQDGLESLASKLMADIMEDFQHTVDVLQVTDRRCILGTVVRCTNAAGTVIAHGGTAADDETTWATDTHGNDPLTGSAWTGKYKFVLELGVDAIPKAFLKDMKLSVCDMPANYGTSSDVGTAISVVRNNIEAAGTGTNGTSCEIVVDNMPEVVPLDANGCVFKVPCAIYYTAASKTYVLDVIESFSTGAVGTGDVVTLWAGNIATSTTAVSFGPNFGLQGLLHWLIRANIETAGGACSTALMDSLGVSLSRASTGNMAMWMPYTLDLAAVQITCAKIKQMANNLKWRGSNAIPIASSAIVDTLAAEVGAGAFRQNVTTWNAGSNGKYPSYGYSGVTIQGAGLAPFDIAIDDWIPSMYVPFIDPSVLVLMSPKAGEWKNLGTGSIWFEGRDTSGNVTLNSQAFYMRGVQMHARDLWNWGAIRYTKP